MRENEGLSGRGHRCPHPVASRLSSVAAGSLPIAPTLRTSKKEQGASLGQRNPPGTPTRRPASTVGPTAVVVALPSCKHDRGTATPMVCQWCQPQKRRAAPKTDKPPQTSKRPGPGASALRAEKP